MHRHLVPLIFLAACGSSAAPPTLLAPAEQAFATLRDGIARDLYDYRPNNAVGLGLHEWDGRVTDASAAGLKAAGVRFHAALDALDKVGPAVLSPTSRLERATLRNVLSSYLFELETLRLPWRSPFQYMRGLNLLDYVSRDYAPLAERARVVVRYTAAARGLLAAARQNLTVGPVPRPWLEIGIIMAGGAVEFARGDAKKALAGELEPALRAELDAALESHATDLTAFREFLVGLRPGASGDFALGADLYLRMLRETEGVVTDLATLERVAAEDTARNLAAVEEAARQIDPRKPTAEVVAQVLSDIPTVDQLLDVAREQVRDTRAFVASHPIGRIASDEPAEVGLSPPFMRVNPAFLRSAGPFEKKILPSFYFISPPDPSWPAEQQRTYIPSRPVLMFITAHEVWPGHLYQDLYIKKHPSAVVKSFCSSFFTEGWAHYAEEMMWDAGFGAGDPRLRIGQLQNALLRDARFLASLGLHTRGMTVEEATKLFQEKAFLGPASARQQAMRGTFDAMYLGYTLGKLMIKKLRDDWKAKVGADYSLQAFHETLLSTGCQALPLLRDVLVGGGPPL